MNELLSTGTGGQTCVPAFINTCPSCVSRPKFPEHSPQYPRSHIVLDFVTNVPESFGNTVILVVLAQFSCFLQFIPLPVLPSAFETAELGFNHLFRDYGILEDIISDRGGSVHIQGMVQFHGDANQEISRFLRTDCSENQGDWA